MHDSYFYPSETKNGLIFLYFIFLFQPLANSSEAQKNEIQDRFSSGELAPIMIAIPSGSFKMGDSQNKGQSYEQPIHNITFSYTFAIGKYPITFEQYDKFTRATNKPLVSDFQWGRGKRPVINVNLHDAEKYAAWLSQQTGHRYRLPSESEWEYAARSGTTTNYPWGNRIGINNANCNGCGSQWDGKQTSPVNQFSANKWGLFDTQGNIWEMTADCWNYNYINAPNDGSAWRTGDCQRGVIRGGSLGDRPVDLRTATRLRNYVTTRTVIIGFRLVREISTPKPSK